MLRSHFSCMLQRRAHGSGDALADFLPFPPYHASLDGWSELERDANGSLRADSVKFPSGMAALAERVHALGLKFGMYGDAGAKTCGGYPGSRGHEEADAALFAGFGVDYLKYDNCYADPDDPPRGRYEAMRDALNATGRPIVYSLCDWGVAEPWLWAAGVGNSWRTTVDSAPNWRSVMHNLDGNVGLARFARPGAWNDPDMLQVGNGLTPGEQRSHFALWCLLKSPLMISSPLKGLDQTALAVVMAPEVIAVHRDKLGVAGDLIWKQVREGWRGLDVGRLLFLGMIMNNQFDG